MGGGAALTTLSVRIHKRVSSVFTVTAAFEVTGGITILFGESGSGKTTLLRAIAGLSRPDDGFIGIGDRPVFDSARGVDEPTERRRVGLVFQQLALFPHLTARDNIEFGLTALPVEERRHRTAGIAESFGIAGLLDRRPDQISGGERQRVGLARSLVAEPAVLLLDEPLSALDYATQSRILTDLRLWNDARRIPMLYVTHSQREVHALGERVLLLQNGAITADGTPDHVLNAPTHHSVALLTGFENLLEAVVVGRQPSAGVMLTRLTRTNVELETPLIDAEPGDRIRVAIRAGDILIGTARPIGLSARNIVAGTIVSLSLQGSVVRMLVDIGTTVEAHLTPTSSAALELRPGRDVWLIVKTHSCHPVSAM
jgi:molybdate transport system ATP-binding protein